MTVVAVTAFSYLYLRRIAGWDAASAFFGSIPGALTMTIAIAEQSPADMRLVSMSQTVRLFMLVAVLPLVGGGRASGAWHGHGRTGGRRWGRSCCSSPECAGSAIGLRLRVPSGLLLGAFIASSLLHGFGVFRGQIARGDPESRPSSILGVSLGLRFSGHHLPPARGHLHRRRRCLRGRAVDRFGRRRRWLRPRPACRSARCWWPSRPAASRPW